ncbi:MAG: Crp/Fnr family transcriptional regulator [Eubacterium sp.]
MELTTFEQHYAPILSFWHHLNKGQRILLSHHAREVSFKAGENVHGNTGECTGVVILKSGSLRAYMLSDKGREISLYRLVPGEICMLSASCVIESITFDVFIDAEVQSEALLINPAIFSSLSRENVYVENFALTIATTRFSDVMWAMEQILFMSFDKRLAIFLLEEYRKTGDPTIFLTLDQVARYTGSAREVVSRMIKYFVAEGMVSHKRGRLTLLDIPRLIELTRD